MDITKTRPEKIQEAQVKDLQKSQKSKENAVIQNTPDLINPRQGVSSEKVKWSDSAQLYSEGLAAAKNAPDVRSDKVAELKAAIKSGQYKVDSNAVAEKMLKAALEDRDN